MKPSRLLKFPALFIALAPLLLFLSLPAPAQESYNIFFRSTQTAGPPGGAASVSLGLQNRPDRVTGFSFGVQHDGQLLTFQGLDLGADLTAALGASGPDADFFHVNDSPIGGDGFTVAMILSAEDETIFIPPGDNHEIFIARYGIATAAPEGPTTLRITDELGAPEVRVILDVNGTAKEWTAPAVNTTATVNIGSGPSNFIRGDVNQSGRASLADGLLILNFLFSQGEPLPEPAESTRQNCRAAFNADGSTRVGTPGVEDEGDIELTDALYLFNFLFRTGSPAPPAPFASCGQPITPASGSMVCTQFTCL